MARLAPHAVSTVQREGWAGTTNGALLQRIGAAGFQAFITMDKSLPDQQRTAGLPFGIIMLRSPSNKLADLDPLAPSILAALAVLQPAEIVRVP